MSTVTSSPRLSRSASPAITVMYAGLALTVIAALVVLIDQATGDMLGAHTRQAFPDASTAELGTANDAVRTFLYGIAMLGVGCWVWMAWAVRRQKRWARASATVIWLLASGFALFTMFAEEYGNTILPTPLGLIGVLPCLAGLVVVVLLWKPARIDE